MQTTFFLISTLNELDRICNNFLWEENEAKNRMHFVGKDALALEAIVRLIKASWQILGRHFVTDPKA